MRRRLTLLVLGLLETTSLIGGATAAATVANQPMPPRTPVLAEPLAVAPPAVQRPALTRRVLPQPPHRATAPVRRHAPAVTIRRTPGQAATRNVSLTPGARMQQAINRIPGYRPGDAVWLLTSRYGHWGVADLGRGVIYIAPSVPAARMYDVVVHEWSHVLSVRGYDGDVNAAVGAMDHWFGGSGLQGAERAADCMARELGATWTHYTACSNASWRAGARRLLAGQRL
jgi:hypothetical protein